MLDARDGVGLGRAQVAVRRAATAASDGSSRERPPRALADLRDRETAPDHARHGAAPEPGRQVRTGQLAGGLGRQRLEDRLLLRAQPPLAHLLPGRKTSCGSAAGLGQGDPSFIARSGARAEQRPLEGNMSRRRERLQSAKRPSPAIGSREVTHRPRPLLELPEQVGIDDIEHGRGRSRLPHRGELGHELQPFEQAGRKHRPDDEGRRRKIVPSDLPGERETQRRKQRAVSADAVDDRPRRDTGGRRRIGEDDPEGLAAAELDEHRLADDEVGKRRRNHVGECRPTGARRIHRDLDEPAGW